MVVNLLMTEKMMMAKFVFYSSNSGELALSMHAFIISLNNFNFSGIKDFITFIYSSDGYYYCIYYIYNVYVLTSYYNNINYNI